MTKIAIQLDDDRNIVGTYISPESGAITQASFEGWTLVDSDPAFLNNESYLWTIRESDSKLVHVSTGKTPDEETKASLTSLTKSQLNDELTKAQLQTALTSLTKEYIQDKMTSQLATTELTKQVADLTIKLDEIMGTGSNPETPTDVKSEATEDGATVSAN